MYALTLASADPYLRARGLSPRNLRELGGGVSNAVLYAEVPEPIVIKQSLGKLRVEQDWFSDRERIHRECDAIRLLHAQLSPQAVPAIAFEDRENCIYAMTAAPADSRDWKSRLFAGEDPQPAANRIAHLLAAMIETTRGSADYKSRFGDLTVFDQLRLDPYYRATAARHPDLQAFFDERIAEAAGRAYCLVHGDWSPKNLLVSAGGVMAIDFEVVHYGDPAFDAAFLLNHLSLKCIKRKANGRRECGHGDGGTGAALAEAAVAFFAIVAQTVREAWFEPAVIRHLAALMLARVDGKSPAEYIKAAPEEARVRHLARTLILNPPPTIAATMEEVLRNA